MGPFLGAALIGGGISALGSALGYASNERNNQQQMEIAKYNWDKQFEFWDMQNEYNSPTAQMERLSKAGLNPNLMYGQGNTGNSNYSPTPQMPNTRPYQFDRNIGLAALQTANLAAQNKDLQASADLKTTQALSEVAKRNQLQLEGELTQQKTTYQMLLNAYQENANPALIAKLQKDLNESDQRIRSLRLQNEFTENVQPVLISQEEQKLENLRKSGRQIDAQTAKAAADAALSRAQILTETEKTEAQKLANKLAEYDVGIAASTQQAKVNYIRYEALNASQELKNKIKDGDLKTETQYNMWLDQYLKERGLSGDGVATPLKGFLFKIWNTNSTGPVHLQKP